MINNILSKRIKSKIRKKVVKFITNNSGPYNPKDKWEVLANITEDDAPTVIDVGAAIESEDSVYEILQNFHSPTIHAFEPRRNAAAEIERLYGERSGVHVWQLAVGSTSSRVDLNLGGGASSVLEPSRELADSHGGFEGRTEMVNQVSLDNFSKIEEADILKMDIQGYEMDALKGCKNLLEKVSVVMVEVNFMNIYESMSAQWEVDSFLRERSFKLRNLYDIESKGGELVWADAIYSKKKQKNG